MARLGLGRVGLGGRVGGWGGGGELLWGRRAPCAFWRRLRFLHGRQCPSAGRLLLQWRIRRARRLRATKPRRLRATKSRRLRATKHRRPEAAKRRAKANDAAGR